MDQEATVRQLLAAIERRPSKEIDFRWMEERKACGSEWWIEELAGQRWEQCMF
jgi:hypothetical protein